MNRFSEYAGHGQLILRGLASRQLNSESLIEFDIGNNEEWFRDFDLGEQNAIFLGTILRQTFHLRLLNLSNNGHDGQQLEIIITELRQCPSMLTLEAINLAGSRPSGQEAMQLISLVQEAE